MKSINFSSNLFIVFFKKDKWVDFSFWIDFVFKAVLDSPKKLSTPPPPLHPQLFSPSVAVHLPQSLIHHYQLRVHSLHEGSLLVLRLLWAWTSVHDMYPPVQWAQSSFTALKILWLFLSTMKPHKCHLHSKRRAASASFLFFPLSLRLQRSLTRGRRAFINSAFVS